MLVLRDKNCIFTETDYIVVRKALKSLSLRQTHIIYLRFWGRMTIEEIAKTLKMRWSAVDKAINSAFDETRNSCLRDPRFSRSGNAESSEELSAFVCRTQTYSENNP